MLVFSYTKQNLFSSSLFEMCMISSPTKTQAWNYSLYESTSGHGSVQASDWKRCAVDKKLSLKCTLPSWCWPRIEKLGGTALGMWLNLADTSAMGVFFFLILVIRVSAENPFHWEGQEDEGDVGKLYSIICQLFFHSYLCSEKNHTKTVLLYHFLFSMCQHAWHLKKIVCFSKTTPFETFFRKNCLKSLLLLRVPLHLLQ